MRHYVATNLTRRARGIWSGTFVLGLEKEALASGGFDFVGEDCFPTQV